MRYSQERLTKASGGLHVDDGIFYYNPDDAGAHSERARGHQHVDQPGTAGGKAIVVALACSLLCLPGDGATMAEEFGTL